MTASLFSPHWHRVARLHPRLRTQVQTQRQHWRGQRWYVLSDRVSGAQQMINEPAWQFIGRCDGRHDVQAVWDAVLEAQGDAAPTQDEVIHLLIQLDQHELMQCEQTPDTEVLFERRKERARRKRKGMVNPFAFRLPLGDPSPWLERLDPLAAILFRPALFWGWLAMMALALLAAGSSWNELQADFSTQVLTPRYLALAWLLFPLVKALHELGHALAVRRWDGEVREVGIALLALVPAPYVDASASAAFARPAQRAAVAAAGIMVETTLAALALLIWLNIQPGWGRDIAFVIMAMGGVSTLLFNGNPLLRFDAYYILCDLLQLPNLAPRSAAFWSYLMRRYVLGAPAPALQIADGEHKWLLLYGPASLAYRAAISIVIVLWFGAKWLLLGLAAAAYLAFTTVLRPVASWARQAYSATPPGARANRVRLGVGMLAIVPGAVLFALPVPFASVVPAVVWLPEQAYVRPEVDGFVIATPLADGTPVQAGDVLAVLENPELLAARDELVGRLTGLQAQQYLLLLRDTTAAQNLGEEIARTEAELARVEERIDRLQVRAKVAGTLVMPRQQDLPGKLARQGEDLGYVLEPSALRVRAAVAEEDAFLVRNRTQRVDVRLAGVPGRVFAAVLAQDEPAASHVLPSLALGDRGGGSYPTDPADQEGRRSVVPLFLLDLTLPDVALEQVGGRAWVRFDHGFEPLAMQAFRRASQLFLKHFDPQG